jgi:hypothetical protein
MASGERVQASWLGGFAQYEKLDMTESYQVNQT